MLGRFYVRFGFRYRIIGTGDKVTLKRIIHVPEPGVHNPETGNTVLTCLVMADTRFGTMEIAGYQFGHDWEIAPGTWTIELWDGDRKLASQSFEAGPRESCILYAAACADGSSQTGVLENKP